MPEKTVLNNKKILLLSPSFFSYEKTIKKRMEEMGAFVYFYDERAITSAFSRALLSIVPWLFTHRTRKYYRGILSELKNVSIDYIIVIKCDMIDTKVLKSFKDSFPHAKLCLYLWDSKKNIKGINKKIDLFDFASSFDRFDCLKDNRLKFRPLFFSSGPINESPKKKSDLCFCGTIHTDRYYILKRISDEAIAYGLTVNTFAYLQAKFMFFFYKVFGKGFKKAKKTEFSFKKKTMEEILIMESESDVVIDIQDPKQSGLTMRTIEMVGANKRFITTNRDVENYDFYNKDNILIIDRNDPHLDFSFFGKEYQKIPQHIYERYSIKSWILDVLGEKL